MRCAPRLRLTIGLGEDVVDCLLDCDSISTCRRLCISTESPTAVNSIGLLVGDLNAEFLQYSQLALPHAASIATNLLNCHDYFYGIQAVKTKVVVEVGLGIELCKSK